MMSFFLEMITAILLLLGSGFVLIGAIGLTRLPDIFTRLHAPTKATTLGIGCILLSSIIYFSSTQGLSLQEVLVTLFLFLTAPVSAQLLSRAALHRRCRSLARLPDANQVDGSTRDRSP